MFQRALAARSETVSTDQPKVSSRWGFRRRAPADPVSPPAAAEEATFVADAISAGADVFGRCGLQLGGLHRDQQWVGAWGSRY